MIIEICLSVISVSFLALVIALIIALRSSSKKLSQIQDDINMISYEGTELIHNLNELTEDLKEKSESLNFIFHVLEGFNKETECKEEKRSHKQAENIAEIVDLIGSSIGLFNRIRGDIKKYVKTK